MDSDAAAETARVRHGGVDDPHVLDFSVDTNPERPPGLTAVHDAALSAARRYPSDGYCEFRTAAADHVGCAPAQVLPTAGGLSGIRLALSVTADPGDSVAVPEPGFGEYAREVRLQGATPAFVAHDAILETDPADHAAVVVNTPHNPTGDALQTGDLQRFAERCRRAGTTLLVDEAYLGFTDRASLAGEPGTVVVRAPTKLFGLPGFRFGFAVANGDLRDRLDHARPAWALSTPAAAVGAHCLRQREFVERTREQVAAERARLTGPLSSAYDVHPSEAPFLLLDVGERSVESVLDRAREYDIAVRDATTFRGLDSHVRVTVRSPAENDRLLDALLDE
jgi:histidinol-phosphate/aromatic aminotransferase/cobyric acid decarboxylase-like protein